MASPVLYRGSMDMAPRRHGSRCRRCRPPAGGARQTTPAVVALHNGLSLAPLHSLYIARPDRRSSELRTNRKWYHIIAYSCIHPSVVALLDPLFHVPRATTARLYRSDTCEAVQFPRNGIKRPNHTVPLLLQTLVPSLYVISAVSTPIAVTRD